MAISQPLAFGAFDCFDNALAIIEFASVKAQFGDDSNEWQALGQTKKSEIARPSAKVKPAAATAK